MIIIKIKRFKDTVNDGCGCVIGMNKNLLKFIRLEQSVSLVFGDTFLLQNFRKDRED